MVGYAIQPPLSIDEKLGYEIHPTGGGGGGCDDLDPSIQLPTLEQLWAMWLTDFEPLLKASDNHTPSVLARLEADTLGYCKEYSSLII